MKVTMTSIFVIILIIAGAQADFDDYHEEPGPPLYYPGRKSRPNQFSRNRGENPDGYGNKITYYRGADYRPHCNPRRTDCDVHG